MRRTIRSLKLNGNPVMVRNHGHGHASPINNYRYDAKASFVTIRDDVIAWYASFYKFRIYKHKRLQRLMPGHPLDFGIWKHPDEDEYTFDEFLGWVLKRFPHGYMTELYCKYLPFVDEVIFTDTLSTQLPCLFERWGYDAPVVLPPLPTNASPDSIDTGCSFKHKTKMFKVEGGLIRCMRSIRYDQKSKFKTYHQLKYMGGEFVDDHGRCSIDRAA